MIETLILPTVLALLAVLIAATVAVRHRAPWALIAAYWFGVTVYWAFRVYEGALGWWQ